MGEPTYEEIKRDARTSASVSIEKNQQQKRDMLAAERERENALPTSPIYGRLRDLKQAVDDGDDIVSDLFAKFDAILSPATGSSELPLVDVDTVNTNSEMHDAIGQLERHVRKQQSQLRYLMERCEL